MHRKSAPFSWRSSKEHYKLVRSSIKGVVESFTIVHFPSEEFYGQIPYTVALISLNNGQKTVSQIVDCKGPEIEMKVEPCLRKIYVDGEDGLIIYGAKFRVVK